MLYRVHSEEKVAHARSLCRIAAGVPNSHYIPFEAPTSIDADTHYDPNVVVSPKADGVRYMLVLCMFKDKPHAFFVNRAEEVYVGLIAAPQRWFHDVHVYEGELCRYLPEPCKKIFLVFNAVYVKEPMAHMPYRARRQVVDRHTCATPLDNMSDRHVASRSIMTSAHPVMYIVAKPCVPAIMLPTLSTELYACDGYIFTPLDDGMTTGRNPRLLKWKSKHTVDLRLVVDHATRRIHLTAMNRGRSVDAKCTCHMTPLLASILRGHAMYTRKPTFDEIVEFEIKDNEVVFNRIRRDKSTPNDTLTVSRTFAAVADAVTLEDLVATFKNYAP